MRRVIAALVLVAAGGVHAADWSPGARAAAIGEALEAVAAAGAERLAIDDAIGDRAQKDCAGARGGTEATCWIAAARAVCEARQTPGCLAIADVAVTLRLAEDDQVPASVRYELMGAPDGYRAAMRRHLRERHAALAAELAAAPELGSDLGAGIDRFCARRARVTALAWQRCVAALVWYIGGQR